MISEFEPPPILDALPNPRGGAVLAAEAALRAARDVFARRGDATGPLVAAIAALGDAGWLAAREFAVALAKAAPLAANDPSPVAFEAALRDFDAALKRHNLRELACSPTLFAHYRALRSQFERDLRASVSPAALALAARPVACATLRSGSPQAFARVRAGFEQALLGVLRAPLGASQPALDETIARVAALSDSHPYGFWRLASACVRALRARGDIELKRFLAQCNLLLGEQSRGLTVASAALVRDALALLWRDYALYGAAAEDVDDVDLLRDYGLTVTWHVAGTPASEALWEANAASAEAHAVNHGAPTRTLGPVTVNAHAYEDFLQTADASMADLARDAHTASASVALQAAEAAYRVGAAATALGLGHTALLADALGLAWRRRAHAGAPPAPAGANVQMQAAEALRAALHQIAAGVAPPDLSAPRAALRELIEGAA